MFSSVPPTALEALSHTLMAMASLRIIAGK
jgi:hypothetical protein